MKNYPQPVTEWHEATKKKLKEFEELCGVKALYWTYFGSRSSGIVHQCSSWSIDYLYYPRRKDQATEKAFFLIGRHYGDFGIDLKNVNQDKNFTYQGYRGKNIIYCLQCLKSFEEEFVELDVEEQFLLLERREQILFFAFAPFLYKNSPMLYNTTDFNCKASNIQGEIFEVKLALALFIHLTKKNYKLVKHQKFPKVHDYLYSVRAILEGLWVLRYKKFPPTDILSLLEILERDEVREEVIQLLDLYNIQTNKDYIIIPNEALNQYIEKELEKLIENYMTLDKISIITQEQIEAILRIARDSICLD